MKLIQLINLFTTETFYLNSTIVIRYNDKEEWFNVGDTINDIPEILDDVEVKECIVENSILIIKLQENKE